MGTPNPGRAKCVSLSGLDTGRGRGCPCLHRRSLPWLVSVDSVRTHFGNGGSGPSHVEPPAPAAPEKWHKDFITFPIGPAFDDSGIPTSPAQVFTPPTGNHWFSDFFAIGPRLDGKGAIAIPNATACQAGIICEADPCLAAAIHIESCFQVLVREPWRSDRSGPGTSCAFVGSFSPLIYKSEACPGRRSRDRKQRQWMVSCAPLKGWD